VQIRVTENDRQCGMSVKRWQLDAHFRIGVRLCRRALAGAEDDECETSEGTCHRRQIGDLQKRSANTERVEERIERAERRHKHTTNDEGPPTSDHTRTVHALRRSDVAHATGDRHLQASETTVNAACPDTSVDRRINGVEPGAVEICGDLMHFGAGSHR
jgi:hypothetical protein